MNKQNGFTLIELLISSLIGLIIMGGIMNLFITTNRSASLSDALSKNQETGRFSMEYLTKFIRKAGYNNRFTETIPAIFGQYQGGVPDITCGDAAATGASDQDKACSANNPVGQGIAGDKLAISYVVTDGSTNSSCTGATDGNLPDNGRYYVDVFWVVGDKGSSQYQDLVCSTYDVSSQSFLDPQNVSIINHVEQFEFQVGLASDIKEQNTARYVNLDTARADPNYHYLVRSIRIAILTSSLDTSDEDRIQSLRSKQLTRTYTLLDTKLEAANDGALRNIFMNTIELTNLIETAINN